MIGTYAASGGIDELLHCREQKPVGQGFFHCGCLRAIKTVEDRWSWDRAMQLGDLFYVYDCGAMPPYATARSREVHQIRQRASGKQLDFLFLSHLHADHVNGVPALLAKRLGMKVDTIIMPLIDDIERLVVFARALEVGAAKETAGFYRDLVVDPVRALSRFAPRQIIVVRRSSPDGDGAPDGVEPVGPEGGELPSDGRGESSGERKLRWKLIGAGRVDRRDYSNGRLTISKTAVYEIEDTTAIRVAADAGPAWILAPYIDPAFRQSATFLRALALELQMTPRRLRAALSDVGRRRNLVVDKAKALRRAYSAVAKNLNLTSMCLLSGPARGNIDVAWTHQTLGQCWFYDGPIGEGRASWLGTADADLGMAVRRRMFLRHYRRHLRGVLTLTMPHHGSERNFHPALLDQVRPAMCVAAADAYRDWRHPATSVVQSIASAGRPLSLVTASQMTAFVEHVLVR